MKYPVFFNFQPGRALAGLALGLTILGAACSATGPSASTKGAGGSGGDGAGGGGGAAGFDPAGSGGGPDIPTDPKTCAEAAEARSYVGCDFYPTVVDNLVWGIFDYAVVVANAGDEPASVTVSRGSEVIATADVAPSGLSTIYLPWVEELKSTVTPFLCATPSIKTQTVRVNGGAYHLVSTRPVTVYQFNALEYAAKGGPAGKDWSTCPAYACPNTQCFSYSNDASLLLPSTAQTRAYRIMGPPAWLNPENNFEFPPYFAVTGLSDNTGVTIKLSGTASIAGGAGVPSTPPGGTATLALNRGDVVQVVGGAGSDFSGTLVTTSAPVQVISGISCSNMPHDAVACDHLEESVFPAETLGKHYFVTVPTSPTASPVGHVVRLFGNVDNTTLTYPGGAPPGAPSTLAAGEMVELDMVSQDFEVVGDHEFGVVSFQIGASLIYPNLPVDQQKGDPAMSFATAVEQFRKKYVFLAPADYDASYADVIMPVAATLTLDGMTLAVQPKPLSSGFGIARVPLSNAKGGAHVLEASLPVGLQVMGYGTYTSYQYPGGLNLREIAQPPLK
ncbi:IgGFc-binding protein [Polyangium sp. y55x31]|uniref:IgGFc-binding protein n=1 Tax=Polyangium sp. y55x31 TaxID=3042688 RepID=UPI002482F3CB|nr:IgGFc-binding protein [Polyangium sp. y55x31]MDI1484012.1 IgGFc-binding protein [Polyangium sp. y55x31]